MQEWMVSVRLMTEVFALSVAAKQKLVLLALADVAADDGSSIFPSVATLAKKTSCSERTIQRMFSAFRSAGVLTITQKANRYRPNVYRLNLEPVRSPYVYRVVGLDADGNEMPLRGDTDVTPAPEVPPPVCGGDEIPGVTTEAVRGDTAVSPDSLRDPKEKNLSLQKERDILTPELHTYATEQGCTDPADCFEGYQLHFSGKLEAKRSARRFQVWVRDAHGGPVWKACRCRTRGQGPAQGPDWDDDVRRRVETLQAERKAYQEGRRA